MEVYVLAIDGGDEPQDNFSILPESSDVGSVTIDVFATYGEALDRAIECVESEMAEYPPISESMDETISRMRDPLNNPDDRLEAADEIFAALREEMGGIKILVFNL